mmetsp:Transcript_27611/g.49814  ORF Transcript_27611/g.49814 Transcript_27611/m.49814 type:complete len:475 (+) Transcript_27611:1477-2901(+)
MECRASAWVNKPGEGYVAARLIMVDPCYTFSCPSEPQFNCLCRSVKICSNHLAEHFSETSPFPHTIQPLNPESSSSEAIRHLKERLYASAVAVDALKNETLAEIKSSVADIQRTLSAFAERTSSAFESKSSSIMEQLSSTLEFFEGDIESFYALLTREGLADDDKAKQVIVSIANLMLRNLKAHSKTSKILEFKTYSLETYTPKMYNPQIPAIVVDFGSGSQSGAGLQISLELLTTDESIGTLVRETSENYQGSVQALSGHIFFTCESSLAASGAAEEISASLSRGGIRAASHENTVLVSNYIEEGEVSSLLSSVVDESGWLVKYLSKLADSKLELSFSNTFAQVVSGGTHPLDFIQNFKLSGQLNFKPEILELTSTDNSINEYQVAVLTAISKIVGSRLFLRLNVPDLAFEFAKGLVPIPPIPGQLNLFNFYNGKLNTYLSGILLRDNPEEHLSIVISFGEVVFRMQVKPRSA